MQSPGKLPEESKALGSLKVFVVSLLLECSEFSKWIVGQQLLHKTVLHTSLTYPRKLVSYPCVSIYHFLARLLFECVVRGLPA